MLSLKRFGKTVLSVLTKSKITHLVFFALDIYFIMSFKIDKDLLLFNQSKKEAFQC